MKKQNSIIITTKSRPLTRFLIQLFSDGKLSPHSASNPYSLTSRIAELLAKFRYGLSDTAGLIFYITHSQFVRPHQLHYRAANIIYRRLYGWAPSPISQQDPVRALWTEVNGKFNTVLLRQLCPARVQGRLDARSNFSPLFHLMLHTLYRCNSEPEEDKDM